MGSGEIITDVQIELHGYAEGWMNPGKRLIEAVAAVLAFIASVVEGEHGSDARQGDVPDRLVTAGILDHTVV